MTSSLSALGMIPSSTDQQPEHGLYSGALSPPDLVFSPGVLLLGTVDTAANRAVAADVLTRNITVEQINDNKSQTVVVQVIVVTLGADVVHAPMTVDVGNASHAIQFVVVNAD